ncbi:helicase protein [Cooperia oncophora]
MSATLDNLEEVGHWLKAKVIATTVVDQSELFHERICWHAGRTLADMNSESRSIREQPNRNPNRKLVLVFSSSKADVEKVALDLAKILDEIYRSNQVIAARLDRVALYRIRVSLEQCAGAVDAVLAQTLPRGGLTAEEREYIEDGFRSGVILVLVATSTLSSGTSLQSPHPLIILLCVNLPASRVVIKAQTRGPAAINAITYKQMSGRAGRLGQVEIGNEDYLQFVHFCGVLK